MEGIQRKNVRGKGPKLPNTGGKAAVSDGVALEALIAAVCDSTARASASLDRTLQEFDEYRAWKRQQGIRGFRMDVAVAIGYELGDPIMVKDVARQWMTRERVVEHIEAASD